MAFLKIKNVRIAGFAAGVPKQVVPSSSTTEKYAAEEFVAQTGIKEKRWDENLTTSDLGLPAAERLIADLGWEKSGIDALVFVSQTPDYILPATSCVLHGKLGLCKNCLCFDIGLGCSGWVYGMSVVSSIMQTGNIKRAILLAGDARHQAAEEIDHLFGYACTVTALEFTPEAKPIYFDLGSDGTGFDAVIRHAGGCRNQFNKHSLDLELCEDGRMRHSIQTRMKGMDVFAFAINTAPKSIKKLAGNFGFDYQSADYILLHQANSKMNETICKKLKMDAAKTPNCMHDFGNTSSASIPLTLITQLKGKIEDKPTKFMGCGFGVGLSWGTIAFETENIVISDLIEV